MEIQVKDKRNRGKLQGVQLILMFAYYGMNFLSTSMLHSVTKFPFYLYLRLGLGASNYALALIIIVAEFFSARNTGKTRQKTLVLFAIKLLIVLMAFLGSIVNPSSRTTWLLAAIAVSCYQQDEEKLFKTGFNIGAILIVALFFLSMLDLVENNRGNAFGYIYRTHYACHLLCLALSYCLARDGKLSWRGEAGLIVLFLLNAFFIKGKTLSGLLISLMLATFWRHYRHNGQIPYQDRRVYGPVVALAFKLIYWPIARLDGLARRLRLAKGKKAACRAMALSFVLCAALIVSLSAAYRPLKPLINRVPGLGSVKARLWLGEIGFEEFPVRPLGNNISQWGLSGSEDIVDFYYTLDSGYVKILLEYGWLQFLTIIGLMTWAQIRLLRAKRYYAAFLLTLFAIDGITEYWIISIAYNLFILLASCGLQAPAPWNAETGDGEGLDARKRGKRPALRGIAMAACALVLCGWCATAYPISTWSGWTPTGSATLVVPGSYIDGVSTPQMQEARLERALQYLQAHEDAHCILAGGPVQTQAMAEWMVAQGVAPDRLSADVEAASADEMLMNAQARIESAGLPVRLTVCTFKMQQARIARRAKALAIPVNSLTVDMPWLVYLPNYFVEQWKILL